MASTISSKANLRLGLLVGSLVSACILLSLPAGVERTDDPAWYRSLNLSAPVNPRFEPFEIQGIWSEKGNQLVGEFWYFNYKEGDNSPPDVTVKGTRKPDGTFWPFAIAQVANEHNFPWKTIGHPLNDGETVLLRIAQKAEQERFYFNLDIFRPMIGKMKYGRVVLETGDFAIFELDDLLPPKTDDEKKKEGNR